MTPKRFLLAACLTLCLSACGLLEGETSPLSDKCYNVPEEEAAHLALGAPSDPYVPGRLLVRYREQPEGRRTGKGAPSLSAYRATAQGVRRDHKLRPLESLGETDLVRLPEGADLEAALERLNADPRVEYAEPDLYLYPLSLPEGDAPPLPDDPFLHEQWHLLEFGLPEAWRLEAGDGGVVLAVLDSGVDLSHEDLAGRTLPGCDLYNKDNDPNPGSPTQLGANQRHGTHVAGIALATGDNGKGVAGVAYTGVKLLPVKVFDDSGRDSQRTATSVVANAIRWAAGLSVEGMNRNPYPARIINLSLGAPGTVQTLNDAVADAREAGALVIAASGNSSSEGGIFAPANAPGAIAVGSVDQDYRRSDFSNYSASGRSVDLMAPGGIGSSSCGTIFSTLSPAYEGATESAYGCEQGTSMAAPFVAGVAALVWSQHPDWTAEGVEARLLEATLFRADYMSRAQYGRGILCADRALGARTRCGEEP